ncbi:MAG: PEP-CTERM sorting domain-containing protein [Verrucomicrobiales bacterium]|jgi:hypothetical protein|nr:PEP-CTERM sorting domain-containing protein [Verrucomicrobiales bacterium]
MKKLNLFVVIGAWLSLSAMVHAENLLINFGTTAVASPYDDAKYNPAGLAGEIWSTVSVDTTIGSVIVDVGSTRNDADKGLQTRGATSPLANYLGTYNYGVDSLFDGTAPGRYGVIGTYGAGTSVSVSGLAAGQYNLFLVSARTSEASPAQTEVGYFTVSDFNTDDWYNVDASKEKIITNGASFNSNTWIDGVNYVDFSSITISQDETLVIWSWGNAQPLNLVQIIAIPEPSTWALLLGGGGLLALLRRRRRGA